MNRLRFVFVFGAVQLSQVDVAFNVLYLSGVEYFLISVVFYLFIVNDRLYLLGPTAFVIVVHGVY